MYETKDIADFLNRRLAEKSGGFLNKWRKNNPPKVNVWLHTKRKPIEIWQHNFPKVFIKEDKNTGATKRFVFEGNGYLCHEPEDVCVAQYKRNDDGSRLLYPRRCGMCRLVEIVDTLIEEGKLKWTQPLFRFEGDEKNVIIHAGGLSGRFGQKDLSEDERKELREAKIFEGWSQNTHAKLKYLFCVVDDANVANGVQIAVESKQLGNRVMDVIGDAMADQKEAGNPLVNPYCIQWEYQKGAPINDQYKARPMRSIPLTAAIAQLIGGPPPDVTRSCAPFNQQTMRAFLEQHALVKLPWDEIFKVVAPNGQALVAPPEASPDAEDDFPHGYNVAPSQDADAPEYDADGDEITQCVQCEQIMKLKATACSVCSAQYDSNGAYIPPPPVPQVAPQASRRMTADGRPKF